ncbi:hypothetical protein [Nocardia macrotermitis]|uniref:hypothetical protein n=1 Tax=Nocardia macrotermitis TaxID=2585198 RepID=UPI0029E81E81|nr:hypothetical protein [Nocardia macrotermitis]
MPAPSVPRRDRDDVDRVRTERVPVRSVPTVAIGWVPVPASSADPLGRSGAGAAPQVSQ